MIVEITHRKSGSRTFKPRVQVPADLKKMVEEEIIRCLEVYRGDIDYNLPTIELSYLKKGRTAGYATVILGDGGYVEMPRIDLNSSLLVKYGKKFVERTVTHEIGHIIDAAMTGSMGHDCHWKKIMRKLGGSTSRCHHYDVSDAGVRKFKKNWVYVCDCAEHRVTSIKHGKMERGQRRVCRNCNSRLVFSYNESSN